MKAGDRQQSVCQSRRAQHSSATYTHFPVDFASKGSVGFGCLSESPSHLGAQPEL